MIEIAQNGPSVRVVHYTDDSDVDGARLVASDGMPSGVKLIHLTPKNIACTSHGTRKGFCPTCKNHGLFAWVVAQ